jgi:hypothetical protein
MTRYEELRAAVFPMLINQRDIADHPSDFTPGAGTEASKALLAWRKYHKVTANEWHSLITEYKELPF